MEMNDYGKRSHSQSDYVGDGGSKRRNPSEENTIGPDDTVYRYLCPVRRIGSIIGKGGEIVKQLRAETQSKIRICDSTPGCDERVVTIYSSSEETNSLEDTGELVSPAQDALFKVHDRVIAEEPEDDRFEEFQVVTVRMLVPSDQIGCILGKGGQVIQNMRNETHAQIRVLSSEPLPPCALSNDEVVQITGEPSVVKMALSQVAFRLHDNPSRSQHLLLSSYSIHRSGGRYQSTGVPSMGVGPTIGPYGGYTGGDLGGDFSLRLVCPTENIGAVIGKGGSIINQIRQESGASIKVDSSAAEGDDCIILVSAKEVFEDASSAIDAVMRLQPRCSLKTEKESGDSVITTRLLVPRSRIGCLIGKGGAIVSEMRSTTRAGIRILSEDNLPKVALEDDEMVQISGDINAASDALYQVTMRLRANAFGMDGVAVPSTLPYLPMSVVGDGSRYGNRDSKTRRQAQSTYSHEYTPNDLPPSDNYGDYGGSQGRDSDYGVYGIYTPQSGAGGLSGSRTYSQRKRP